MLKLFFGLTLGGIIGGLIWDADEILVFGILAGMGGVL